jgi:hypothetical protein
LTPARLAGTIPRSYVAGPFDLDGFLQFADRPADAPVVHFDGPLQVTFYGERPSLRLGRDEDVVLVVGTSAFSPDGKTLAVGGAGGVHLFHVAKKEGR